VLLADVPNAGVSTVDPNARSGNPRHDTASGKFGSGDRKKGPSQAQANIDPVELRLMRDAVRDAARLNEGLLPEDAETFLKKRVRDFTKVDFQSFLAQVREQRLEDLADILATQTSARIRGGKPKIKVSAPRGYVKRVFTGLSDDEVVEMALRMERKGFSQEQVRRHVITRVDPDRVEALDQRYGEISEKYGRR
jgi:hypothetical protein